MCGVCGNVVRVGFWVPNAIWEKVVHTSRLQDIHCLECFTKRADEKLIRWDEEIKFYPVSFAAHLDPDWEPQFVKPEKRK